MVSNKEIKAKLNFKRENLTKNKKKPSKLTCGHCGEINPPLANYCAECGLKLENINLNQISPTKPKDIIDNVSYGCFICSKCDGYYKLDENESPFDYDHICSCGGELFYVESFGKDIPTYQFFREDYNLILNSIKNNKLRFDYKNKEIPSKVRKKLHKDEDVIFYFNRIQFGQNEQFNEAINDINIIDEGIFIFTNFKVIFYGKEFQYLIDFNRILDINDFYDGIILTVSDNFIKKFLYFYGVTKLKIHTLPPSKKYKTLFTGEMVKILLNKGIQEFKKDNNNLININISNFEFNNAKLIKIGKNEKVILNINKVEMGRPKFNNAGKKDVFSRVSTEGVGILTLTNRQIIFSDGKKKLFNLTLDKIISIKAFLNIIEIDNGINSVFFGLDKVGIYLKFDGKIYNPFNGSFLKNLIDLTKKEYLLILDEEKRIFKCPECKKMNYNEAKSCEFCGKSLENILGYFEDVHSILFTKKFIKIFKKKNPDDFRIYYLNKISKIELGTILNQVRFFYEGNHVITGVKSRDLNSINKIITKLNLSKHSNNGNTTSVPNKNEEYNLNLQKSRLLNGDHYKLIKDFATEHLEKNVTYSEISLLLKRINKNGFSFKHDDIIRIVNQEIYNQKTKGEKQNPSSNIDQPKKDRNTTENVLVDINNDSEEIIASLPGVGPIMAKKVMNIRESNDGFSSFEELSIGLGLKPHIAKKLETLVIIKPKKEKLNKSYSGRVVDI